jgi:glutamate-1-semialdehyde 2,1-aminomutase
MGPVERPNPVPYTAGMPDGLAESSLLILPFNDENAFRLIEQHAEELAVVLIEPVQVAYAIAADQSFLERLRALTREKRILLAFDEVVTKFRLGLGGGETLFGVSPDLAAYAKIMGGGLPIGAVGCRAEVIDAVTQGRNAVELGGTFNGNVMTVRAANAVLDHLLAHPEIYPALTEKGDYLRRGFNDFAQLNGYPATMLGLGSMFRVLMVSPPVHSPRNASLESVRLVRDFHLLLRLEGVFAPYPARTCYLSTAHSDADVEFVLGAHQRALRTCMLMNPDLAG